MPSDQFRYHRYDVTRRVNGVFPPDDDQWTTLAELVSRVGEEAAIADYLPVEDRFVAAALLLFAHRGTVKLRLNGLRETPDPEWDAAHPALLLPLSSLTIRTLPLGLVDPYLRASFREQIFCHYRGPGIDLAYSSTGYTWVRVIDDGERSRALVESVGLVAEDRTGWWEDFPCRW